MAGPNDDPTIRDHVEEAVADSPAHLQRIYDFVLRFRPGTAEETIRARVYEAVDDGRIRRLARGIYFARRGPASLLLVHGDARDVLTEWDDDSIDAIVTDPPYDLGTKQHAETGTTRPHRGEGRTYDQFDLDRELLAEMFRVLRKETAWNTLSKQRRETDDWPRGGGALVLFAPPITRSTWPHIRDLIGLAEELGFVFYGALAWDHEVMGMGYDCGRNRKNEILLFAAGERNGVLWDLGMPNVLRHKRLARRDGEHEAEKPVGLFLELIEAVTRAGDVMADFFAGRARWVREALKAGRHVVAVEKDERWVEAVVGDFEQTRLPGA